MDMSEIVNYEMMWEANNLEMSPENILRLVDLIFLGRENEKDIPS